MPICTREGFDFVTNGKKETFNDNDDVFFCEVTKQIFREYDDYFRHVMAINSTVWQCEVTGRENLTYAEALKSERKARKKMELFKDSLRPAVMLVIEHAKQSSLNNLIAITSKFIRKRYFLNEELTACHNSSTYNPYKVLEIIPPDHKPPSKDIVYDATEQLLYRLKRLGNQEAEITVPFENIRRPRQDFTSENLAMFVKDSVTRVDGILRPKPASYKKYVTDRKINFEKLFIGKMPHFTPAKSKPHSSGSAVNGKKQSSLNKYLVKNGGDDGKTASKSNAQERAKKDKEKAERAEAKAKSLKEEMERLRREKQEKLLILEREKAEKREKLIERVEKECTELLTKTDDLERTDQRVMPQYTPIRTYIPTKILGDAFMLREFMHSFCSILSSIEVFRSNLSFYELSRAFSMREVAGPLSDILLILLGTIFDLQKEEEEKCPVEYLRLRAEQRIREPQITMYMASKTHEYSRRHFSTSINQLPLDAQTISEVLRLHILSSGASVRERTEKWRNSFRNGYASSEDPGLLLRMQNPHILRVLKLYTVYQLPFIDIMRVVRCLMSQILTYSVPINLVEERMEQTVMARAELRALTAMENKRLAQVQQQRKALTCEYHQQCMNSDVKGNEEKRKQLEEKLNKKINELLTQSMREQKKYETKAENLNASLFDFMVHLGTDRAYRNYYVFESMPGIFVEHPPDAMDTCLEVPPVNALNSKLTAKTANLPKNRKDLRAYLLRLYTEEEKKAAAKKKLAKNKKDTQENKENQENRLTNGGTSSAGPDTASLTNGIDKMDGEVIDVDAMPPAPPTQYQLYMCSGDSKNCIVHDARNPDRQIWAYLYQQEDIDALIDSLNPLGERESHLLEQLQNLRAQIINHAKSCPCDALSVEDNKMQKFKSQMLSETNRKYGKSNFGFAENADLNEVMYSTLVDRILQFENEIYTGDLGRLKVKDMEKWRRDVQQNTYDSQVKLQWGPANQKLVAMITEKNEAADGENGGTDVGDDEDDLDVKDSGQYANKPYVDPGASLGDSLELNPDDSNDRGSCLHEENTLRRCVKNLSSALLQVEQAVERRFLKEPFGVSVKDMKDKEVLERKMRVASDRLKQWEVSLMQSTSYSQVFLHLNILYDAIMWARSTNKSMCQVCRRGSEPEKMLLCDECNGGTHTFCMKPKMKTVPEGNWYCKRCVTLLGLKNEPTVDESKKKSESKRKRIFVENEEENASEVSSVSSASRNNGPRSSGRYSGKRLQPIEIEQLLCEDDNDEEMEEAAIEDDELGEDEEQLSYNDEEDPLQENDDEDEDEVTEAAENSENSSQTGEAVAEEELELREDEDEVVCVVCSYDGGDVTCSRCCDSFHLECIDLKRPPRFNFICNKCRVKEDKKRRNRINDDSDYEYGDIQEPAVKRFRHMRASLRNSAPNANSADTSPKSSSSSSSRRTHRRMGEDLPLNSPILYELLDDIMKHEDAWPFLRPVLPSEVPDYYDIIKSPMDFAKVKSRLNMGAYQLNEEVLRDIQLIFQNCDLYNAEGNEIYEMGSSLEKFVIERCKELNLPFSPSDMNT